MPDPIAQVPNLYALLIGVDCYLPNRLPDGSSYKSLGGCVRDIQHVEAFLKAMRKVPETQILKLTASTPNDGSREPIEPPNQLPTRSNIVASFRQIGQLAPAGAQVYIHYSGHGGRAKTVFPDIKGAGEIDEGLVPTDIGTSEGQYLRDLELAQLLKELADKKLFVTLVLDCCHSGGATRGDADLRAEIRGMAVEDEKPLLENHQPIAPPEVLAATWQALNGSSTRGLKAGGVPESGDYIVFAACRQNEYALEYPFNRETKERNGALTYWLLDTLKQPFPGQTYKDLFDRINAKIHSQFPQQTPILLGEGSRKIFGNELGTAVYAISVMSVESNAEGVQAVLEVGQATGVGKGAEFAIYPRGTTQFTKENRVAIAKIIQRGATESICQLQPMEGKALNVEQGDQAVQISASVNLVRKVLLFEQEAATPEDLAQAQLPPNQLLPQLFNRQKQALDAIRQVFPTGWVELAESFVAAADDAGVDYIVTVNNAGEYEICDGGGTPFKNIKPALKIGDANAPAAIVRRLTHLAKYRATAELDNTDTDSPLAGKLAVDWLGTSDLYEKGDPMPKKSDLAPFADPNKPTVKANQYVFLSIRNDATQALNVAVLNLEADWAIEQILPTKELFITLEPGKEKILPLKPSLEGDGDWVENVVKVFATLDAANFRPLELPSLDQPLVSRGGTRSGNPLEALFAAIGDEQPPTRKLTIAASPSSEWTTKQITLTITK